MALGLAAFRKYIPADLVKRLINDGTGARLGGVVRPMSVMFVDLAGFTGMSERLGDRVIPLLSRYFDAVSAEVQSHGGTIDKFIGDAVMAFWGAPALNPDHAVDCCRAALACQRAVREVDLGRRPRPGRENPHRHQFRRHAGGQYRIGGSAQLYRHRRCGERCKPALKAPTSSTGLRSSSVPENAPFGGRSHFRTRAGSPGRLWGVRAVYKSTNCWTWPKNMPKNPDWGQVL